MTYNFDAIKIPTFTGINDVPIEPTATKAGNGSHVITQFNALVDETESALNTLESLIPTGNNSSGGSNRYKVITDYDGFTEYTASVNENVIIQTGNYNFDLTLPDSANLNQGDFVTLINCSSATTIKVLGYDDMDGGNNIIQITFNESRKPVTFVWMGDYYRWFSVDSHNILNKQYQAD
jgi:hypothetical protein